MSYRWLFAVGIILTCAVSASVGQELWGVVRDDGDTLRRSPTLALDGDGTVIAAMASVVGGTSFVQVLRISDEPQLISIYSAAEPDISPETRPALVTLPDGDIVVATESSRGVIVRKIGPQGQPRFEVPIPGAVEQISFLDHLGPCMVRGEADHVYLTTEGGGDILTVKISPDGSIAWSRLFADPGGEDVAPTDIVFDEAGRVTVAGVGLTGMPIVQYDSNGSLVWSHVEQNLSGPSLLLGDSYLATGPGGVVVLAGNPESPCGQGEIFLKEFDALGGTVWERMVPEDCFDGFPRTAMDAKDVAVDSDGDVVLFANGIHHHDGFNRFHIYRFGSGGLELWHENFDASGSVDVAVRAALDQAGRVHVAGYTTNGGDRLVTASWNPAGAELFAAEWQGNGGNHMATDVVIDSAGALTVAGTTWIADGDAVFLRYQLPPVDGVPAVSAWGLLVMALMITAIATITLRRTSRAAA